MTDSAMQSQFDDPFVRPGRHGKYSGVVDIAKNGIDEVIRLRDENKRLKAAIERMRVAGGSKEFQMAFELAKDLL